MAFTKVTGPGIHTLANITSHNINSSGIITATKFVGPLEASSGSTGTFDSLTVTGNVSVGGTLTYEDVTNIDSVGIITARKGISVSGGGTLDQANVTGVSTFTGTIDANGGANIVGGLTVDQVNATGISTFGGYISLAQKIIHTGDPDTSIEFDTNTIKFETQGAEAIRIQSDSDVGIGTINNSNNERLRVQDDATTSTSCQLSIISGNAERSILNFGDKEDANIGRVTYDNNDNHLSLWTDNTERVHIDSDGLVGIGTVDPQRNLHIHQPTATNSYLHMTNATTGATTTDGFSLYVATDGQTYYRARESTGTHVFYTGTTEKLRITNDGDVLIGGHSSAIQPDNYASHLQVHGTATDAGISILRYSNNSGGPTLLFGKSRGATIGAATTVHDGDDLGKIEFYGTDHTGWESSASVRACADGEWYSGSSGSEDNTDAPGRLEFHTTPNGADNLQERLRITSGGRVLIATTDEGHSNADDLTIATAAGSLGNTGITIRSSTSGDGNIFFSDATSGDGETKGVVKYAHSDDSLRFNTAGSERLRIRDNGNVSIASSLAVTGITTSSSYDLSAISTTISGTVVDLFVYDTRKDSDGGAWRKRTSHTSWYNETFSATRGSKKEFPAVAVISVRGGTVSSYGADNGNMKIKIYDGDDPEMPLWMEFEGHSNSGENFLRGGANYPITSVSAANGVLCIGRDGGYGGALVSFIDEFMYTYWDATSRSEYAGSIAERNSGKGGKSQAGLGIINATVNDVAMTVLPNAKIMNGTGLPSPTIAFATVVGATVIKEVGIGNTFVAHQPVRVYDDNGTYDNVNNVQFTKDGKVVYTESNGSQFGWMYVHDIPYKDTAVTVNNQDTALSWYDTRDDGTNGHGFADIDGHIYSSTASYGVKILHAVTGPDDMIYTSTTSGVTMIQENRGANRSGLVAHVTHSYNTGWLLGDQKFCLSDTDDTNKTNTQTEYDRSIAAKNLTVHGTVTKTAVATGAEMVSWSFGDSNSNYLKQAYNAQLQFGTGDFSVMGWIKMADYSNSGYVFDRADSSTGNRIAVFVGGDRTMTLYTNDGATTEVGSGGNAVIGSAHDGKWVFFTVTRHSGGTMESYINGELRHSVHGTPRDVDNDDAFLIVGGRHNNASGEQFDGEIALLRISKSVPSPEQVAKIYNDEKDLFVANAKCSLYGSSSSITALAHDEDNDTLHVGTSGGRSDFIGLNRINNTTTAVTTAISASNGLIIEQ